jgi:hypothetical protein
MLNPRDFLGEIQAKVGGEISGGFGKTTAGQGRRDWAWSARANKNTFILTYDGGYVKVQSHLHGEWYVRINGEKTFSDYSLKKLLPQVLRHMGLEE